MRNSTVIKFKETQRFTQWWLWLTLGCLFLLMVYGFFQQLILGKPLGDNPVPNIILILITLLFLGVICLIGLVKLCTEIDEGGIQVQYFPLASENISWDKIKRAEVVRYSIWIGWGIRMSSKYGTVYNTKGNKGLAIGLINGEKILIGTQKEQELREVLEEVTKRELLNS